MTTAVIVDAVRTPLAKGKPGGGYAEIHPVDLHAHVLRALVDRTRIDPAVVDDGISGELIAQRWGLSRAQLDEFAAESHQRAARAWKDGLFDSEISYVNDLRTDETIRPGTTAEGLAALRLAFRTDHWAAHYPDLD